MTDRARLTVSVALTALIALGLPGFAASGYVTEIAEVGTSRLFLVDPGNGTVPGIASDLPIGFDLGRAGFPPAIVTGVTVTRDGSSYVTGDANNSLIRVRSN